MTLYSVRSFGNNKIQAIKLVRMLTNCGLREAKDLVEQHGSFTLDPLPGALQQVLREAVEYGVEFEPALPGEERGSENENVAVNEPGSCSVRYVSGEQAINAIKRVRELTGFGLSDSKRVVDTAAVFKTGLHRHEAEAIVREFAAFGARVEILEGATLPRPNPVKHDYQKPEDFDF